MGREEWDGQEARRPREQETKIVAWTEWLGYMGPEELQGGKPSCTWAAESRGRARGMAGTGGAEILVASV